MEVSGQLRSDVAGYRCRIPGRIVKMVAVWSSETLVVYPITTMHHNPEGRDVNLHRRELFKCFIFM
jgi:hypothetical protein